MHGFDFFAGGIEDGIIAALQPMHVKNGGYVKSILPYGGQLDGERLRSALGELTPLMPLILVSYGDGKDVEFPPLPKLPGRPLSFKHECSYSAICCSDDARGEKARRRDSIGGVYKMITDVRDLISGMQFRINTGDETMLLNPDPMKPVEVQFIARLPELTAYAQHFDTYFHYTSPDRREAGASVRELIIAVDNLYPKDETDQRPGVLLQ